MLSRKDFQIGLALIVITASIGGCSLFSKTTNDSRAGDDPSWNYYEMSDDREQKIEKDDEGGPFSFLRQGTQGSGVTPEGRDIERRLGYR